MWIAELDGRATGEEEVVALARFVVAGRPPLWSSGPNDHTRGLGGFLVSFFSLLFFLSLKVSDLRASCGLTLTLEGSNYFIALKKGSNSFIRLVFHTFIIFSLLHLLHF